MRSLWIHGWASDSRVFGPLIAALPPALSTTAEAIDIPGYASAGESAVGGDFSAWMAALLCREAHGGPVVLGGWSMGAMLALEAAAAAPESVRALVLVSGCARFPRDDGNPRGQDPRAVRAMLLGLRRGGARVVADFLSTLFSSVEQASANNFHMQCGHDFTKISPAALSDGLNYLLTSGLTDRLERKSPARCC